MTPARLVGPVGYARGANMIKVKNGVEFFPGTICATEFWLMPFVAQMCAKPGYEITITSGADGTHKPTSLHYTGDAVDIRTRDADFNLATWVNRIQRKLGTRYTALLEKDHIHIQFNG
jgi:hypothetical protein